MAKMPTLCHWRTGCCLHGNLRCHPWRQMRCYDVASFQWFVFLWLKPFNQYHCIHHSLYRCRLFWSWISPFLELNITIYWPLLPVMFYVYKMAGYAITQLPGRFVPLDILLEYWIELVNTAVRYITIHLYYQLGYSTGLFKLSNWLSVWCLVAWVNHLPSVC